jgi:hypothetical protein
MTHGSEKDYKAASNELSVVQHPAASTGFTKGEVCLDFFFTLLEFLVPTLKSI